MQLQNSVDGTGEAGVGLLFLPLQILPFISLDPAAKFLTLCWQMRDK